MMQRYAAAAGLQAPDHPPDPGADPVAVEPVGQPGDPGAQGHRPAAHRVAAQLRGGHRAGHHRAGAHRAAAASTKPCAGPWSRAGPARSPPGGPGPTGRARPATPCRPTPSGAAAPSTATSARRPVARHRRPALAGDRGHRWRPRLVLVPAGLGRPGPARPTGRWRRPSPGSAPPRSHRGRRADRLLAGGGPGAGQAPAPPGRDAAARARRGWSSTSRPTRATARSCTSGRCSSPAAWPARSTGGRSGPSTAWCSAP